jgi:hypothetical protein
MKTQDEIVAKVKSSEEISTLEIQVKLLKAALEPFAKYAEIFPPRVEGANRLTDTGPILSASKEGVDRIVTFADFRNALQVYLETAI